MIPVYQEGTRFLKQVVRLEPYLHSVDLVIVDGGSEDDSVDSNLLFDLGVRTVLTTESPGLSKQLRTAFHYCLSEGYEHVITMDGNGKDGVEGEDSSDIR